MMSVLKHGAQAATHLLARQLAHDPTERSLLLGAGGDVGVEWPDVDCESLQAQLKTD